MVLICFNVWLAFCTQALHPYLRNLIRNLEKINLDWPTGNHVAIASVACAGEGNPQSPGLQVICRRWVQEAPDLKLQTTKIIWTWTGIGWTMFNPFYAGINTCKCGVDARCHCFCSNSVHGRTEIVWSWARARDPKVFDVGEHTKAHPNSWAMKTKLNMFEQSIARCW